MARLSSGLIVSILGESHKPLLAGFDCGNSDSNDFVKNDVFKYQAKRLGVSYVLQNQEGKVVSIITLAAGAIALADTRALDLGITDRIGKLPALKIGRLCTHKDFQRQGNGAQLIDVATGIALKIGREIGCFCLLVDSKISAINFYRKLGFDTVYEDITGRTSVPMYVMLPPE